MATRKSRPARTAGASEAKPEHTEHAAIHLPPPSYWPIALALGVVLIAIGIIFTVIISVIGVAVTLAAIVGWTQENRDIALKESDHE